MNKILVLLLLLAARVTFASDNTSNDFGHSSDNPPPLSADQIAYRFHVSGEVFVTDKTGEKLLSRSEETRDWQFGANIEKPIASNWLYQRAGLPTVALHHEWTISKDGTIAVNIQQYDNMIQGKDSEVQFGKLVREQKITLKDFAVVNWVVESDDKRVVIRLTPDLWMNSDAIDVNALPLAGKNAVVFDSGGHLWGTVDGFSGQFFGVNTVQGTVALSYHPFKGAKLIGEAKEGRITLKNGKDKIMIQSERPLLPTNVKANVYGLIDLSKKTERLHSVRTFTSDKEDQFLKDLSSNEPSGG